MNHHIIICWFSPLFLEALLLFLTVGLVSVTRDWMCQRCRWIHSILPPPPASKGRVRRCPWCWNTGSHISYCSSLFLSFSHQNHLIRYNFPVIPPPPPQPPTYRSWTGSPAPAVLSRSCRFWRRGARSSPGIDKKKLAKLQSEGFFVFCLDLETVGEGGFTDAFWTKLSRLFSVFLESWIFTPQRRYPPRSLLRSPVSPPTAHRDSTRFYKPVCEGGSDIIPGTNYYYTWSYLSWLSGGVHMLWSTSQWWARILMFYVLIYKFRPGNHFH